MKKKRWKFRKLLWASALVVAAWIVVGGLVPALFGNPGEFGDRFGAVNALFSGLAFSVLIYTMLLQRKELKAQREELAMTRAELSGQKEQFVEQNKTLALQRFENTFFELLRFQSGIVDSLYMPNVGNGGVRGRNCFEVLYRWLTPSGALRESTSRPNLDALADRYSKVLKDWQKEQIEISHYIRNLQQMLAFLNRSGIDNGQHYAEFIKAQLVSQELVVVFYHAALTYGGASLRPLIEKYAILEFLNDEMLADPMHKSFYSDSAYGLAGIVVIESDL